MVAWANQQAVPEPAALVTDDNPGWRDIVGEVLRRAGFRTLVASCGEEAIELVRHETLDVVLLDFQMPRLDGLETLRRIRRHDRRVPAVLMTARPDAVPPTEVRALGVTTVLAKPAGRERIVKVVRAVVRWRRPG